MSKFSCTWKLSNCLDTAITDFQEEGYNFLSISGPSRVAGNFSEVFFSRGCPYDFSMLWSFAISEVLRLTMYCRIFCDNYIYFGIGFTPADVPANHTLLCTLGQMPPATDVWMMLKNRSDIPLELFVTHGNFLVRGHMTNG
ncbi:unnamed protein product [Allacma fusca]|uniref:Uncharacterized protein n=1 Tax=Allacma fusca TaxID=39272 RepID=A0A8J2KEA7_9HEXA|nr:unnamed protein product [Allacma fusca]